MVGAQCLHLVGDGSSEGTFQWPEIWKYNSSTFLLSIIIKNTYILHEQYFKCIALIVTVAHFHRRRECKRHRALVVLRFHKVDSLVISSVCVAYKRRKPLVVQTSIATQKCQVCSRFKFSVLEVPKTMDLGTARTSQLFLWWRLSQDRRTHGLHSITQPPYLSAEQSESFLSLLFSNHQHGRL